MSKAIKQMIRIKTVLQASADTGNAHSLMVIDAINTKLSELMVIDAINTELSEIELECAALDADDIATLDDLNELPDYSEAA